MLKITNGTNVFEVTQGAYDTIFKHQGYCPYKGGAPEVKEAKEPADTGKSENEEFLAGLVEKPISQWSKAEVKKFAELKGIDISGTKNAGEAKGIIKNFLDEQEQEEAGEE